MRGWDGKEGTVFSRLLFTHQYRCQYPPRDGAADPPIDQEYTIIKAISIK